MTYLEKLKDPRWQKKRLEILQRDNFTCQDCGAEDITLHIHHKYYEAGREPWLYPEGSLITLCEYCHEAETDRLSDAIPEFIRAVKKSCMSSHTIMNMTVSLSAYKDKEYTGEVITHLLQYPEIFQTVAIDYLKYVKENCPSLYDKISQTILA